MIRQFGRPDFFNRIGRFVPVKGGYRLWIQPVDATDWLNRSAGVSQFSIFVGEHLVVLPLSLVC